MGIQKAKKKCLTTLTISNIGWGAIMKFTFQIIPFFGNKMVASEFCDSYYLTNCIGLHYNGLRLHCIKLNADASTQLFLLLPFFFCFVYLFVWLIDAKQNNLAKCYQFYDGNKKNDWNIFARFHWMLNVSSPT